MNQVRFLLIVCLSLSSCTYPQASQQPFIKVVSEEVQFVDDGPYVTAKGRIFVTNVSRVNSFLATVQVIFMVDKQIIGQVEKRFFEPILFDNIKEITFEERMFVPYDHEKIEYMIQTWSQ